MSYLDGIKDNAESGDAFFQTLLGFILQFETIGERDKSAARDWFRQAAQQGYPPGQFLLYELLWEDGERDEAVQWLKQSAESGFLPAQASLGSHYWLGDHSDNDYEQALRWLKLAADGGHCPAMSSLAMMYEEGVHVERDSEIARTYLRAGAEKGNSNCASMLGRSLLHDDSSSEDDISEGLKWIYEAAKKQDSYASLELSTMYRFGLYGTSQNEELAKLFDALSLLTIGRMF